MTTETVEPPTSPPTNHAACSDVGTVEILGMMLPIMASLDGVSNGLNWYLVAHPNGPAIGCTNGFGLLATLEHESGEMIPEEVRRLAVATYRELTWGYAKKRFRGE